MTEKKDFYDQIEFDSEAYTSLHLTQKAITRICQPDSMVHFLPLKNILKNPIVFVLRYPTDEKWKVNQNLFITGDFKGREVHRKILSMEPMGIPFAVVCILHPTQRNKKWKLSREDLISLNKFKDVLNGITNCVYVLKLGSYSSEFTESDRSEISQNINECLGAKSFYDETFANLFIDTDKQIPIRVGLCILQSVIGLLKDCTKLLDEAIEKRKQEISSLNIESTTPSKRPCKISVDTIASGWSSDSPIRKKTSRKSVRNTYETAAKAPIDYCYRIQIGYNLKLRSEDKSPRKRGLLTESKEAINRSKKLAELNDELSNFLTMRKTIVKEVECRENNLLLHQWKTLAARNDKIKGFGFVNGAVEVYLKDSLNIESDKNEILEFFKRYTPPRKFELKLMSKSFPQPIPYASLEQGSRIKNESSRYGSLGIFLSDNDGRYFFTTCAHVIWKDKLAYSVEQNMILGKNVFTCHPNLDDNDKIDFSLVQISPENEVKCQLGLKSSSGNFIEGYIFRGDITEIVDRNIYKWGATQPHFQRGKCIGYESENDCVYSLVIDTDDFVKEGDSGSVICIEEEEDFTVAAFVAVGGKSSDDDGRKSYAVYKVSDAIEKLSEFKDGIEVCLIPNSRVVKKAISAVEETDISEPKPKRLKQPSPKSSSPL